MSTRRVSIHEGRSIDREKLVIVQVFEEGLNKEEIRKLSPYSKKHQVLISDGNRFRYKQENA